MAKKKLTKKQIAQMKKAAKKNPAAAVVLGIVMVVLIIGFLVYYFMFLTPQPLTELRLNGSARLFNALNTAYVEKGATFIYKDTDMSSEITISYYDGANKIDEITTDIEKEFTVKYSVDYEGYQKEISRTVVIADTVEMSINFLELGNAYTGDSTYIKAGDVDILIDAGSRQNSATAIANYIDQFCDDGKLEYVIATHAHQDHIAGFVGSKSDKGIFDRYEIETLIDFAGHNTTSNIYKDYASKRDTIVSKGTKHYTAADCCNEVNGAKKSYDIAPGITMDILYQRFYEETTSDENDYSVCVMFTQGNNHYLFTGDLEKDGEKSLVMSNTLPEVELFKGGHHGSYTANTDELLNVIKPKNVCICCCAGSTEYTTNLNNTFPAQDSINRIAKWTDKVYVTTVVDGDKGFKSLNGNIKFYSAKGMDYLVTGSNNSVILKETDWFKENRTWPTY